MVAPITLLGLTALSVETSTKCSTPRDAGFHQPPGPQHVVGHGVFGVGFHQRHVLVRRRVEDDFRPMRREHRGQTFGVRMSAMTG